MLLVIQFPISDARRFLAGGTSRLDLPDWPPSADFNPQFFRCFGSAVRRRGGPDAAWVDERTFCNAHRALRFPALGRATLSVGSDHRKGSLLSRLRQQPRDLPFVPACAFRRLFFDGVAVARLEIGVAQSTRAKALRSVDGPTLFSIIRHFIELPTEVTRFNGDSIAEPIMLQGLHLARLYEAASTRSDGSRNTERTGLVESGMPLVVVEVAADEVKGGVPEGMRVVDPTRVLGARIAFDWIKTPKGVVPTWIIERGSASHQQLRSLRLSLLRLHAEREALDLVLRQIRRGRLSFDPETDEGDDLQEYLNHATRMVQRDWVSGVSQAALLGAFDANQEILLPEDRTDLSIRLEKARNQILRKVAAYEEKRGYVRVIQAVNYVEGGNRVEHNEQIITGGTFTGPVTNKVASEKIEGSFNTVAQSGAAPELKNALDLLNAEVKALVSQLENQGGKPEQLEDVASLLETFTKHATEKRPLKEVVIAAGKGLIDAAKAIAERVTPIASAVGAVLKVLGIPSPI